MEEIKELIEMIDKQNKNKNIVIHVTKEIRGCFNSEITLDELNVRVVKDTFSEGYLGEPSLKLVFDNIYVIYYISDLVITKITDYSIWIGDGVMHLDIDFKNIKERD